MRTAIVALLFCSACTGSSQPGDAGSNSSPAGPIATTPTAPDGGEHWAYVGPTSEGEFHSSGPGDLWLGKSHLVNGSFAAPVQVSGTSMWVVSPRELWTLQGSTLHHWTGADEAVDISRPDRNYELIADGWISYEDSAPQRLDNCSGWVGIARWNGSALEEQTLPDACGRILSISGAYALTEYGEAYYFDGGRWSRISTAEPASASNAMYAWTGIRMTDYDDVIAWGWGGILLGSHYDGTAWSDFKFDGGVPVSVWTSARGPRWVVANGGPGGMRLYEFAGGAWQDRGAAPGTGAGLQFVIGSDGTDVYFACAEGVFRYRP